MDCLHCGNQMVVVKDRPYHYTECGLDDVTIIGITTYDCSECDESYTAIPKIKELHNVIGELICKKEGKLIDKEVRFIRKEMRMKGKEFALMLGVSAEFISRIENGAKPISATIGRLIRAMYMIYSNEGKVVSDGTFIGIAQPHEKTGEQFNIQLNPPDWLTREGGERDCHC